MNKSPFSHGRTACAAMHVATGIKGIRSVEVSATHDDVTVFRVEFIATDEQAKAFGEALAQMSAPKPSP